MAETLSAATRYTYLRIHISEITAAPTAAGGTSQTTRKNGSIDELSFRKSIQDALTQTFGTTHAGTYVDILNIELEPTNADAERADSNTSAVAERDASIRGNVETHAVIRVASS